MPHKCPAAGHDASVSIIGSANVLQMSSCSSTCVDCVRAFASPPSSGRLHAAAARALSPCPRAGEPSARPSRPITAASTSSFSQRHGARSVPATDALVSDAAASLRQGAASTTCFFVTRVVGTRSTASSGEATHDAPARRAFGGNLPQRRGTSAKRAADNCSPAQASRARNARPAGCGRRVPRSNHAGTPARVKACSSNPNNCAAIARASPSRRSARRCALSRRMRRAISTDSRPSPGAENTSASHRAHARAGSVIRREQEPPQTGEVAGLADSRASGRPLRRDCSGASIALGSP